MLWVEGIAMTLIGQIVVRKLVKRYHFQVTSGTTVYWVRAQCEWHNRPSIIVFTIGITLLISTVSTNKKRYLQYQANLFYS